MTRRQPTVRTTALRQTIAQEAARIMAEEGVRDFGLAKRKAAQRLGASPGGQSMPTNREIDDALEAHQRLFGGDEHERGLRRLREAAIEAMTLFAAFEPRLVGPVLRGTASPDSPVTLHLFSDAPEQVVVFLMGTGIPYDETDHRVKRGDGRAAEYPALRFVAGSVRVEATIFPTIELRQAPTSPVDGRPMPRANLQEVQRLAMER